MLPCVGCAYRERIPGDEHSRCVFAWDQDRNGLATLVHGAKITPRTAQWFRFPYNFDPIWGPGTCSARSEQRNPDKIAKANPLADLLSLLR